MRIALRTMLFLIALIATASAVSHEEIERKGAEIMEEYRRDGGHWTPLNDMTQINHVRTTRAIFRVLNKNAYWAHSPHINDGSTAGSRS